MNSSQKSDNPICAELRGHILAWFNKKFPDKPELAEDLTQEVLLRLSQNLDRVTDNVKGYLKGIMLHVYLDYLRGSYRKPPLVPLDGVSNIPTNETGVRTNEEMSDEILDALNKLPGKARKIILLKYVREMQIRKVAEVMNMKESAVKMQLGRALEKLRSALSKSDFF